MACRVHPMDSVYPALQAPRQGSGGSQQISSGSGSILGAREKMWLLPIAEAQADLRAIEKLLIKEFVEDAHQSGSKGVRKGGSQEVLNNKRYAKDLIKLMLGGAKEVKDHGSNVVNYVLEHPGSINKESAVMQKNTFLLAFTKCGEEVIAAMSLMLVNGSGLSVPPIARRGLRSTEQQRPQVAIIVLAATEPERRGRGVMSRLLAHVKQACAQQAQTLCVISDLPWDYAQVDADGDPIMRNWWRARGGFDRTGAIDTLVINMKNQLNQLKRAAGLDQESTLFCPWPIDTKGTNLLFLSSSALERSLEMTTTTPEPPYLLKSADVQAEVRVVAESSSLRGRGLAWKGAKMQVTPCISEFFSGEAGIARGFYQLNW